MRLLLPEGIYILYILLFYIYFLLFIIYILLLFSRQILTFLQKGTKRPLYKGKKIPFYFWIIHHFSYLCTTYS